MDKAKIKEFLTDPPKMIAHLEGIYGNKFEFHEDFVPEFMEQISRSGSEQKLIKQLLKRLAAIIALGNVDYGPKWLEHLKTYGNMYSLHLDADSKNYRLLFSKTENGKLFLHVFYEKEGKTASSYAKHVPIAIERRDN